MLINNISPQQETGTQSKNKNLRDSTLKIMEAMIAKRDRIDSIQKITEDMIVKKFLNNFCMKGTILEEAKRNKMKKYKK